MTHYAHRFTGYTAAITGLLSEDASNVSGAIIPVDGGWAAI